MQRERIRETKPEQTARRVNREQAPRGVRFWSASFYLANLAGEITSWNFSTYERSTLFVAN